jgi:hypothetical protein
MSLVGHYHFPFEFLIKYTNFCLEQLFLQDLRSPLYLRYPVTILRRQQMEANMWGPFSLSL